jgi:hypothetical protein
VLAYEEAVISDLEYKPSEIKHPKYNFPCYSYKKFMQKIRSNYNALREKPPLGSVEDKMMKINKFASKQFEESDLKINFLSFTPKVNLTHAIILISGWLSEDSDKKEEWKDVIKHPFSPVIYSYIWSS